jgi:nitronate monooxygenase
VAAVSFTFGCPPRTSSRACRPPAQRLGTVIAEARGRRASARRADRPGHRGGGHRVVRRPDGAGDYGCWRCPARRRPRRSAPGRLGATSRAGAGKVPRCGRRRSARPYAPPGGGTAPAHRAALAADTPTSLTRAFTGRQARGIVNRFLREHSADAPLAYPEIHHVTAPLRAAGRAAGDADMINLWAGQAHELARDAPAAEVVAALAADARECLDAARRALPDH